MRMGKQILSIMFIAILCISIILSKQNWINCFTFSYIIVRGLIIQEEVSKLKQYAENDSDIAKYSYGVEDGKGGKSRMCIWNHPGNDISGNIIRFVVSLCKICTFNLIYVEYNDSNLIKIYIIAEVRKYQERLKHYLEEKKFIIIQQRYVRYIWW